LFIRTGTRRNPFATLNATCRSNKIALTRVRAIFLRRLVPRRWAARLIGPLGPLLLIRVVRRVRALTRMGRVFDGVRRSRRGRVVQRLARRLGTGRIVWAWPVHVRYLSLLEGDDFFSVSLFGDVDCIGFLSLLGVDFCV